MTFDEYEKQAAETVQLNLADDQAKMELVFGLISEVGCLARAFKLYIRDNVGLEGQRERLTEDIGDVQWYVAMIAKSLDIRLQEVVDANLRRTHDRYLSSETQYHPKFDEGYPATERFPRRMLFESRPAAAGEGDSDPHAMFTIVDAQPYPLEFLEVDAAGKRLGFVKGDGVGDAVNDNAPREDGYRYHDAVHVAFMAVLGWSPVLRHLLRIKRKSNDAVDRYQDGARARDVEEALSAVLKVFSRTRNGFATEADVDGETRDMIRRVVSDLEVADAPIWLWAKAISQGFVAMDALHRNSGGWLIADLDAQTLTFHQSKPEF